MAPACVSDSRGLVQTEPQLHQICVEDHARVERPRQPTDRVPLAAVQILRPAVEPWSPPGWSTAPMTSAVDTNCNICERSCAKQQVVRSPFVSDVQIFGPSNIFWTYDFLENLDTNCWEPIVISQSWKFFVVASLTQYIRAKSR